MIWVFSLVSYYDLLRAVFCVIHIFAYNRLSLVITKNLVYHHRTCICFRSILYFVLMSHALHSSSSSSSGVVSLLYHITQYEKFTLFGHEYIDGDCLWGMLWLGSILEAMGKEVSYYTPIEPSALFWFLPDISKIKTQFEYPQDPGCTVFIDFTPYDRIGSFTKGHEDYFDQAHTLIIDHHPDARVRGSVEIKDVAASSVCEWLYDLISQDPVLFAHLDERVATYLLMWVMTDTGNFTFEKDSPRTFDAALWLLRAWARKIRLVNHLYRSMKKESLDFASLVRSRIRIKGLVLSMRYTDQELEQHGLEKTDLDRILWLSSSIAGNWVVLVARSVPGDVVKWSLRSKSGLESEYNVSTICHDLFGWWGHRNASWFTLASEGELSDQVSHLVDMINQYLDKNKT